MTDHDGLYHQLYEHPAMMADLMQQFVTEPWVQDLDLARMEPVKTKFQVPGLPKRTSDIIWRIPTKSGSDVYLLVLLELQSKSDRWMVLRVIVYMCLLWLQLLHEKRIPAQGPLPPLFPMVLHNGDTPWLTPVCLQALIDLPDGSPLWKYQPNGRFFLIDECRFLTEDLKRRNSMSALVFRVEQCHSPEDLPMLAEAVIAWLEHHPEFAELRQVLASMLLNAMNVLSSDNSLPTGNPIDLLKVPSMLQTRMETWRDVKQKEWRQEGGAAILLQILQRRFPDLPTWVATKVLASDLDRLRAWTDLAMDAHSLQDVFGNEASGGTT
ncbi:MAG: Rpn family recombination-promoting nuclease/putative transposase [Magnetococcus sp. DMHC-1]|nr:Rpn family recombination-promoting nuclease/putative transposase [Magnetococcales bacterium]